MKALIALTLLVLPISSFGGDDELRRNDPATDPYTEGGSAELLKAAGYPSMGGFKFCNTDTAEIDEFMATSDIRWIETEHFELGFALGSYKVKQAEKKLFRAELAELAQVFPSIKPKAKVLDPWLRAHMYARRLEVMYQNFLELIQVDAAEFPDGTKGWDLTGTYMGEGPHLGQKGKYEVIVLPSEAASVSFLKNQFGLSIKMTQRELVIPEDALVLVTHIGQGQFKIDSALHGHLTFNMAISFLDGYKHYSYESPIWLREGLGHYLERKVDPRFNTFDSSEGSIAQMTRKEKWAPETKKLVRSGKAPRMAKLINLKTYAELKLDDHFATWSMVDFLVKTQPAKFAIFLGTIKGRTDDKGYPLSTDLKGAHREAFKAVFDWSYAQFDTAWSTWVMETY